MIGRNVYRIGASLSAVALLAMPSQTQAFCCLFRKPAPVITNYAPACPAPCPAPACAPQTSYYAPAPQACTQTCNYVPQTSYRSVVTSVPVTTYRPVTTCDPCTGCPRTVLQPTCAYVQQTQLVPYTSYRPVMTTSCYSPCNTGCAPASPCAGGACGTAAPMSLSSYAPTPTYSAPAVGYGAPSPGCCGTAPSAPAPATIISPAPGAPTVVDPANSAPTLPATPIQESSLRMNLPVAPAASVPSSQPPRELDPEDRTAARPIERNWSYRSASQSSTAPAVEDSGWRSAR